MAANQHLSTIKRSWAFTALYLILKGVKKQEVSKICGKRPQFGPRYRQLFRQGWFDSSLVTISGLESQDIKQFREDFFNDAVDQDTLTIITATLRKYTEEFISRQEGPSGDKSDGALDVLAQFDTLNIDVVRQRRREQHLLRNHLIGGRSVNECAICNETWPSSMIVAAHIKPRAECEDHEMRDLKNIGMAACLVCDKLYENGYLGVNQDGKIILGSGFAEHGAMASYLKKLNQQPCRIFHSANAGYFDWHYNERLRKT